MNSATLDIVVPCYNPEKGWGVALLDEFNELDTRLGDVKLSLILVNDGSDHGVTEQEIQELKEGIPGMRFIAYADNRGKGFALRRGVSESVSSKVIYTDIDFPYEIQSIVDVYKELELGSDVALGFRSQDYYTKVPRFRKMLSQIFRWLLKAVFKLEITDSQCGLKGFNESGKQVFLTTTINRFLFDLEFVMLSSKDTTISTKPVLVKLREGVVFSKVNMKVLLVEFLNLFALAFYKRKPPHNV